ncbi:hypothetical protein [Capnocytophaga granulosa]|jgi:hypothetical protein|nr:MAG TPA: hypothetical protein [Caudoviricetes sp.]
MEPTEYTYKGIDLRTAEMWDIAMVHKECSPLLFSYEKLYTEEQMRLLNLVDYAENYELTELSNKLSALYQKELSSIRR